MTFFFFFFFFFFFSKCRLFDARYKVLKNLLFWDAHISELNDLNNRDHCHLSSSTFDRITTCSRDIREFETNILSKHTHYGYKRVKQINDSWRKLKRWFDPKKDLRENLISFIMWSTSSKKMPSTICKMHRFISRMRKVSSGHLLSSDTFYSVKWFW